MCGEPDVIKGLSGSGDPDDDRTLKEVSLDFLPGCCCRLATKCDAMESVHSDLVRDVAMELVHSDLARDVAPDVLCGDCKGCVLEDTECVARAVNVMLGSTKTSLEL